MPAAVIEKSHARMFSDYRLTPTVDAVGVEERAARFQTRSLKKDTKRDALLLALSMIDHTTLEGADTPARVERLCKKALRPAPDHPEWGHTAAVCVYPPLVKCARKILGESSPVKIAAVSTYFPSGQAPLKYRLEETRRAVDDGADEIDMVISRGKYLAGEYEEIFDEISATKEACGAARLKVILETGELQTYDHVRRASHIAMDAGADFIKTSTGKVNPAATLPVTIVMLQAIRDHYDATGVKVGMKPAGGIRDAKTALHYLVAVREILGEGWLSPEWFRFGASSLTNDIVLQLHKQTSGHYHCPEYVTRD